MAKSQNPSDNLAIQNILQQQVNAWNKGDATAFGLHFAEEGTFTNILGLFFTGHKLFVERHDQVLKGVFNKTVLQQHLISLKFAGPDVAIVETLTTMSGLPAMTLPGISLDAMGNLNTRLLQVMKRVGKEWEIITYNNVDLKAGTPVPEI